MTPHSIYSIQYTIQKLAKVQLPFSLYIMHGSTPSLTGNVSHPQGI